MLLWLALQTFDCIHEDPDGGADSAVSPDGATIAFSSRRKGSLDLWLVDVKTKELRQLTKNPKNDYEPRWSPDGSKIVFTTDRNGNQDIWIVDVKSGEETELTHTVTNEDYPSFSQDGSKIVFTGGPWVAREVHVLDVATKETKQITKGHRLVGAAAFSPPGDKIVYHVYYNSYESGESDVFIVDAAGGEGKKLIDDKIWDYKPMWSYDGAWIAFSSKRDTACFNVWMIKSDGTNLHKLTTFEDTDARWPNFTKDGRLAFHRIRPHRGLLRAVDVESGATRDLATFGGRIARMSPSPDRSRIAYELNNAIYVVEKEVTRELAKGTQPTWSPDGKRVAFLRNRTSAISIVDAGGGTPVKTEGAKPKWPESPDNGWSPDGAWIAIVIKDQVSLVSTKDGTVKTLTKGDGVRELPVWSADGKTIVFAEFHPQLVQYYLSKEPVK